VNYGKWEASSAFPHRVDAVRSLVDHGAFLISSAFPADAIREAHDAIIRLFSLPLSEKARFRVDKAQCPFDPGFTPFGEARALDTKIPNLLEAWDFMDGMRAWPREMGSEHRVLIGLRDSLRALARLVLAWVDESIGIKGTSLFDIVNFDALELHLIHYVPTLEIHPVGARRQSIHTDNTIITLIPTPCPAGAEVLSHGPGGEIVETIPIGAGDCLVQAGRFLEHLTGSRIKAHMHSIPTPDLGEPDNVDRYSTPFFVGPKCDIFLRSANPSSSTPVLSVKRTQDDYFAQIFGVDNDLSR
jgi:isopenicillin N synthase-like dioxygenase